MQLEIPRCLSKDAGMAELIRDRCEELKKGERENGEGRFQG